MIFKFIYNTIKYGFIGFFALCACLLAIGLLSAIFSSHDDRVLTIKDAQFRMDAVVLLNNYRNNEAGFNHRFANKNILVFGNTEGFSRNGDHPVVLMGYWVGATFSNKVRLHFNKIDTNRVYDLNTREEVQAVCKVGEVSAFSLGDVTLTNCHLV